MTAAKPYLVKKAEGNPGKRKLREGPRFTPGFGPPPRDLKGEGRKLWKRYAPELEEKRLSAVVYGAAFEGLCRAYGRAREAEAVIARDGMTFTTEKGYVGQRPEVAIAMKSWAAVRVFCGEFGLTASANGKIAVPQTGRESLRDLLTAPAGKAS